jgi:hypothetical protein
VHHNGAALPGSHLGHRQLGSCQLINRAAQGPGPKGPRLIRCIQGPEGPCSLRTNLSATVAERKRPGPKGPRFIRCIQGPEGSCSLRKNLSATKRGKDGARSQYSMAGSMGRPAAKGQRPGPEGPCSLRKNLFAAVAERKRPGPKGPRFIRCIQGPEGPCSLRENLSATVVAHFAVQIWPGCVPWTS